MILQQIRESTQLSLMNNEHWHLVNNIKFWISNEDFVLVSIMIIDLPFQVNNSQDILLKCSKLDNETLMML